MPDHAALLHDAQRGDPEARARLAEIWLPVVARWCARLGGPSVDADDAAHDAMVRVLRRLHTVRDPARLPGWIFGVTRRVLAAHRRRAWVRRWLPGFVVDPEDPSAGPQGKVELDELAADVQLALETLPADLREVLVLCEIEERKDVDAAALIGIPVGTLKSRLRRARGQFAAACIDAGLAPDPSLVEEP